VCLPPGRVSGAGGLFYASGYCAAKVQSSADLCFRAHAAHSGGQDEPDTIRAGTLYLRGAAALPR
jgi:hypothetical protein